MISITKTIDAVVDSYMNRVAKTHNIDMNSLKKIWDNMNEPSQDQVKCESVESNKEKQDDMFMKALSRIPSQDDYKNVNLKKLPSMKKPEIEEICKKLMIQTKGFTKGVLIDKINEVVTEKCANLVPEPEIIPLPVKRPVNLFSKTSLVIRKNTYGNYEHSETSFVFDQSTHTVIGKQSDTSEVLPLTKEDIDVCNQYKFLYDIPYNLDACQGDVQTVGDDCEEEDDLDDAQLLEEEDEDEEDNEDVEAE